jgi:hypothetical protein
MDSARGQRTMHTAQIAKNPLIEKRIYYVKMSGLFIEIHSGSMQGALILAKAEANKRQLNDKLEYIKLKGCHNKIFFCKACDDETISDKDRDGLCYGCREYAKKRKYIR